MWQILLHLTTTAILWRIGRCESTNYLCVISTLMRHITRERCLLLTFAYVTLLTSIPTLPTFGISVTQSFQNINGFFYSIILHVLFDIWYHNVPNTIYGYQYSIYLSHYLNMNPDVCMNNEPYVKKERSGTKYNIWAHFVFGRP